MKNAINLIAECKNYKDKADSFWFSPNMQFSCVEEFSQAMLKLRDLCERELPKLVKKSNALTNEECSWMFVSGQNLFIEEYDHRLLVFSLIVNPNAELAQKFMSFKKTVSVT